MEPTSQKNAIERVTQFIQLIVAGGAALVAYKSDRTVGIFLAALALILSIPPLYRWTVPKFKSRQSRRKFDLYAAASWDELTDFHNRFLALLNPMQSGSLRMIVDSDICRTNATDAEKIFPRNALKEIVLVVHQYHDRNRKKHRESFERSVALLSECIRAYAGEFNSVVARLKSPDWRDKIDEHHKRVYGVGREEWVRFLDDWMGFLRRARIKGYDFGVYFQKPELL